jgi:hypothetical protein
MGLISGCRCLKVNLKEKMYICVNSTIQRCPNKIIKIYLIEDFSYLPPVSRHRWSTLSCEYLGEFSKKFETVLLGYSRTGGKLIDEKNQKRKISWHCPFNTLERLGRTEFTQNELWQAQTSLLSLDRSFLGICWATYEEDGLYTIGWGASCFYI